MPNIARRMGRLPADFEDDADAARLARILINRRSIRRVKRSSRNTPILCKIRADAATTMEVFSRGKRRSTDIGRRR